MTNVKVLVVDDDAATRTYLCRFLGSRGYTADWLDCGDRVLKALDAPQPPALVLLDLMMPRVGGLEILSRIRSSDCQVPVIVMSAVGQAKTVVKAMRMGAADYLVKPFEDQELERSVRDAIHPGAEHSSAIPPLLEGHNEYARHYLAHHEAAGSEYSGLFDSSAGDARFARIKDIAAKVADTDAPVLILGETGVGKEVLAHYIHAISNRASEPFVKVNCAALPADLLESELFGYERGAFTGAARDKPGKFEMAGKGTLLLDEIGEMSPALQAKLLHVLQDGECMRLGGTRTIRTEARILAATNRRLEDAVAKREFRQDLFFRLNVVRLEIPPLRARSADIPRLTQQFLEKYQERYGREALALPPSLVQAFRSYSWPGNVRQLENAVRRFVILMDPELVLADMLKAPGEPASQPGDDIRTEPVGASLKEVSALAAEQAERETVLRMLDEVNWNRKEAARRLNVCYKSLLQKLHRWNIPRRSRTPPVAGSAMHMHAAQH